jgi:hypothetical protein
MAAADEVLAEEPRQLGSHLTNRFVGESDGEDVLWVYRSVENSASDAAGQHPCLARARAGHDRQYLRL